MQKSAHVNKAKNQSKYCNKAQQVYITRQQKYFSHFTSYSLLVLYCFQYDWWLAADVLVIDEISMVSAELFDTLNELAKRLRKNPQPFGGIQLVLVSACRIIIIVLHYC